MRKILSFLCVVVLIFSSCIVNVSATDNLVTPEITSITFVEDNLSLAWDYYGSGENAFEIWRSTDNGANWSAYWRTAPGEKSAQIPTGGDYTAYWYKVAPVNSNNEATYFSAACSVDETAPYARYTFDDPSNIGKDINHNYNLINGDDNNGDGYEVSSVIINGKTTGRFAGDSWDDSLVNYNGSYFDSLNEFTISVRAKVESLPDGFSAMVSTGWDDIGGFTFGVNNSNEMFFDSRLSNGTAAWICKATEIDVTADFHEYTLAVTNGKKTVNFYLDGYLIHSQNLDAALTLVNTHADARNRFVVGQIWWQGGYKFKGWMDNINIYNTALTDAEVSRLYNYGGVLNLVTESATLISKYSFEQSGDLGADSVGNVYLKQNGTGITQVDGAYGKAAQFDGTSNLSAGVADFQSLTDYTISFFASVQQTGDVWYTTVQNGSKLKIFLNPNSSYVIIQDQDGGWLNYYDMNKMDAKVADMHHYAVSVSNTNNTITLYIDGVERNKTNNANELDASNNWHVFSIGGVSDTSGYHDECIKVTVDEVNVYDGTLTFKQVEELYNGYNEEPFVPETNTPDVYYKFDSENIGKEETGKHNLSYDAGNLFRVPSLVSTGGAVEFVGGGSEGGWQEDLYIENNFTEDYTNFTVSCQLNVYELFGVTNISIVSTGWDDRGGFTFGLNNLAGDYYMFFDGRDTAGNTVYISGTISEEILNVWHSYSLVVSGGGKTVSLYCDSNLIATTTFRNPLQMKNTKADGNDNRVVIGNQWWRAGGYEKLIGEMDNLCFYNKALSVGELAEITGVGEVATVGDANDDGEIDIRDLVNLKKHIVAGDFYLAKYDCTKDFNINAQDLTILRQYLLGLVFEFDRIESDFVVASAFSDDMVLQRDKEMCIYGLGGEVGSEVTVTFAGQTKKGVVEKNGWKVYLDPMEANNVGSTLAVENGMVVRYFNNVVVGEVFFCSGQSNMATPYGYMLNKDSSIEEDYNTYGNISNIRVKDVPYAEANEPVMYTGNRAKWKTYSNLSEAVNVSATALAYGLNLSAMLDDEVPIGLITCAVGGSSIETWLSEEYMEGMSSNFNKDSTFYNGMLHSVIGYTVKGFLWYQACADAQPQMVPDYRLKFERLATMLRTENGDADLPIITFQLVQFNDWVQWLDIRQAQFELAQQINNVYMVCGIDTGCNISDYKGACDVDGIHPVDKWFLGERAAGIAVSELLGIAYDDLTVKPSYGDTPYISSASKQDGKIVLTVANATSLTSKEVDLGFNSSLENKNGKIAYFEVYNGTEWTEVEASIAGATIILDTDIEGITAVRYLQQSVFADGTAFIYNEYGNVVAPIASVTVK